MSILCARGTQNWRRDLESARNCFNILIMCAPVHNVAQYFLQTLQEYVSLVESIAASTDQWGIESIPATNSSDENDYLFGQIIGNSDLHHSCRKLYRILGRPFAHAPQQQDQPTLHAAREANPAARLNWATNVTSVFNGNIRQELRGEASQDSILSECLETIGSGHFIDSQEPHGWLGLNVY
jgi:hypothetical protein